MKINLGDWGIKAGALALAGLLWFHAATEYYYEKEVDIRLQVEDPSSDPSSEQIVVANFLPARVRVRVSGRGKDLLRLNGDDFLLHIQPEGSPESVRSYRLMPANVERRAADLDVQITEVLEPKEITIALDRKVKRRVEVIPFVELEVAEAYTQVGNLRIEPREVEVAGPQSQVHSVDFIKTDSLMRKDVREDIEYRLPLRKPRGMRLELNPDYVTLKVDIQILAEDDIFNVPIKIRHARGRSVIPEPSLVQVKVRGGVDIVANLDQEKDLDLYVDYREYDGGSLSVRAVQDSLFEIIGIIPSEVNLVVR